ncbi:MAG TPA: methionine--tRNA ligase [Intrasporangium sp.]|uniref:methionine--tRNA ligase n=1 Tax=Intrasporangium sp. TaxID=1925024 RepID=UPI002B47D8DE|nr:methionine--tRNA ligase [Intrasporangium sp.]HKX68236.1 methionine--tRNA ligase [Intrasporangium sp.]
MSKVLSAVAWPYTNGPRHIGHVAGFGVPSDVFSRYMRMAGHDVLMVSGTDEHGTPILVLAEKEGLTAQEVTDKYNRVIATDLTDLGLSYDLFTRTTTANHYAVSQELFTGNWRNGYMIEQTTKGAISPSTGRTLPDRYIEGTCPICGYGEARGDQCDNCGNQLDADELINPRSKINGETPEFVETQHFFLDLPALAGALGEWLDGRETSGTWRPNVIKFARNLLDDVRPRAMTRDIDWGIPIPLEGWEENTHKRLYVWFDAVVGYLSASIEWARRIGEPERWREFWDATQDEPPVSYYFQGKDNITFHAQIWPAELLGYAGLGDKGGSAGTYGVLNLPTEVVASEFMTMEGKQFSTSRGHVIHVRDVLERYGPDPLRYFICAAGPENQDSDFTWAEFVQRNNSELVAGWGNLVNRTASMIAKNFGQIPAAGPLEPVDEALLETVRGAFATVGGLIERHRFKQGIAEVMRVVGEANRYVAETEPFKLKGDEERERLGTVLHVLAQAVVSINTLTAPFLPHGANRVHRVMGGQGDFVPMPVLEEVTDLDDGRPYPVITGDYSGTPRWEDQPVVAGTPIAKPTPVFTKFDPSVVEEEIERMRREDEAAAKGQTDDEQEEDGLGQADASA